MPLSLKQEADRIEDLARQSKPDALAALNALLDRPRRLERPESDHAMSFNAKLVTELRTRTGGRFFVTYQPPENPNGQPLPIERRGDGGRDFGDETAATA